MVTRGSDDLQVSRWQSRAREEGLVTLLEQREIYFLFQVTPGREFAQLLVQVADESNCRGSLAVVRLDRLSAVAARFLVELALVGVATLNNVVSVA